MIDPSLMMAQSWAESTRDTYNYVQYINQFLPNRIKAIRQYERIQKKICRQKISIMFNEICINEEMLPKYIYMHIYIYIYIYIYEESKFFLSSRWSLESRKLMPCKGVNPPSPKQKCPRYDTKLLPVMMFQFRSSDEWEVLLHCHYLLVHFDGT